MAAKVGKPKPIPLRMGFAYIPNGVILPQWRTTGEGRKYNLSPSLRALEPFKNDIQALDGLDHKKANANGDGGGDHARANATFLTGCQARKTAGSDIRIGVSVDQLAAEHVGKETKLPSLELSTDRARLSGGCDSGYSCAYQYNLAWKTESLPMPPEANPRSVFERLFSGGLTKEQAEERGLKVTTGKIPMGINARYLAEHPGESGLCKVVVEEGTRRLLGVHMIGGACSEMIFGAAVMLETELREQEIEEVVFPHPTASEVIKDVFMAVR